MTVWLIEFKKKLIIISRRKEINKKRLLRAKWMLGRKAQLPFSSQGSQEELKKSRGSDIYSHLLSFSPPHKPGTNTENQNRLIQRQTAHRLLLTSSSSQNKTTVKEKRALWNANKTIPIAKSNLRAVRHPVPFRLDGNPHSFIYETTV